MAAHGDWNGPNNWHRLYHYCAGNAIKMGNNSQCSHGIQHCKLINNISKYTPIVQGVLPTRATHMLLETALPVCLFLRQSCEHPGNYMFFLQLTLLLNRHKCNILTHGSLIFWSNPLAKPNAIAEYSPFSHEQTGLCVGSIRNERTEGD